MPRSGQWRADTRKRPIPGRRGGRLEMRKATPEKHDRDHAPGGQPIPKKDLQEEPMHGHSGSHLEESCLKIERQKPFLPAQRFSIRCIHHNPASEQPCSEGLTNPHKRSTLPDRADRYLPISCMQEHFSCLESYGLLAYQSRAFIRHQLVSGYDYYFLSKSALCRRTDFGSQAGADRS